MTNKRLSIMALLSGAMILAAFLRVSGFEENALTPLAGLSTPLYVGASILAALALQRTGLDFNRLGFGFAPRFRHLWTALIGVVALQLFSQFGYPLVAGLIEAEPGAGAERFSNVEGDTGALLSLLVMSWTVAAIGEELTFRIILMRGFLMTLGGGPIAAVAALVFSAALFGFIHLYKGPVGMISSGFSGLVFGLLVLVNRGAIWPAFLAHGLNNTIGILRIYQAD